MTNQPKEKKVPRKAKNKTHVDTETHTLHIQESHKAPKARSHNIYAKYLGD